MLTDEQLVEAALDGSDNAFAEIVQRYQERLLRFLLARSLARIRSHHLLPFRLGEEIGGVIAALISIACASYDPPASIGGLEELTVRLQKVIGRRVKSRLQSPALELSDRPFSPDRWLGWMEQTEDRLALTITGDLMAALEVIRQDDGFQLDTASDTPTADLAAAAGPRTRHLLSFAVSEEYLTLRERLGMVRE
mgnify:CR=1 FL=1